MTTTSVEELFRALPGWQRYGNRIEKTFNFDDFGAPAPCRRPPSPGRPGRPLESRRCAETQ